MNAALTRCPGCGEDRLIDFDRVLQRWICAVCSTQWRTDRKYPVETFYEWVLASPRWARMRDRLIRERGRRCQRCRKPWTETELQGHHLTYERLGFERDEDVEILCPACHPAADAERKRRDEIKAADARADAQYARRLDGWARKRYGDDWDTDYDCDAVEDAFERWLDAHDDDQD